MLAILLLSLPTELNAGPVTDADVRLALRLRDVPAAQVESRMAAGRRVVQEQRQIAAFLNAKRVKPDPAAVDRVMERVERLLVAENKTLGEAASAIGVDVQTLRREVSLPVAWRTYVRTVTTDEDLRKEFEAHRAQYDGTRVHARQIFVPCDGDNCAAAQRALESVRSQIMTGKTTFADAAAAHSKSPSAAQGGDLGWIGYDGSVPAPVAQAALPLKVGAVSRVIPSAAGRHLVTVEERKPGDLSVEDARPRLFETISQRLWDEVLAQ